MRVLITGATGFAGGYLAEALVERGGVELCGAARRGQWSTEWQQLRGRVEVRACDLTNPEATADLLRAVQPQQIYHLAGYAHVGRSFHEPKAAWDSNLAATLNLYECVAAWGGKPRILYVSSGLIYGDAEYADQLLDERSPLRPASPYAVSKAAADLAGYQYARAPGLDVVRVRPFNHIGPRQSPEYAVASFSQQIAAIAHGQQPPVMETGDLSPRRDLTDVRDMVRAYVLLMERGRSGEAYNAGSGEMYSMQSILERLQALAGVRVEVRQRAVEQRVADTMALRADARKLREETGWQPEHTLDSTLTDTLTYWRQQL